MKQISLSMALKLKSRLIGEINGLKLKIVTKLNTTYLTHDGAMVDKTPEQLQAIKSYTNNAYESYKAKLAELCELKVAIQTANSKIVEVLAVMEETKATLKFHEQLLAEANENSYFSGIVVNKESSNVNAVNHSICILGKDCLESVVKDLQNEINSLQDQLDTFNGTTMIFWKD